MRIDGSMSLDAYQPARPVAAPRDDKTLRKACGQLEGMFVSILMKEGLASSIEGDSEENGHTGMMLETAVEQMANEIGNEGGFGMARMLYEQLSDK